MKKTKMLVSLVLALAMVFAMAIPAFAAETGTITVKNATVGQTYTVYEILKLDSYNFANKAYLYKATDAWNTFINSTEIKGTYLTVEDGTGYVKEVPDADMAKFAKLAQKYAADNNIANQGTTEATTTTVEFTGLELGYYLLDSTMGTLCSLNTTKPTVEINEKNGVPTNEKKVNEKGTYGTENDAEIGQTMEFQSTIVAQKGAQNYVFHDTMTKMNFIEVTGITLNGNPVATDKYTVNKSTDTAPLEDGCTFEVVFDQEKFCDTLVDNDKIVVSYTAYLNGGATIGAAGNANESKLSYGEEGKFETTPSKTISRTWDFNVFKYTTIDGAETPLSGATFNLSRNADGSNPISFVKVTDGSTNDPQTADVYRPAIGTEAGVTDIVTNASGKFTIQGLDSETYYLKETKAPDGYNLPTENITTVVINNEGKINATDENPNGATDKMIKILNQSGTELPSTGGIGTTIFYIVGGILLVGAGVVLVVRRRMRAEVKSK